MHIKVNSQHILFQIFFVTYKVKIYWKVCRVLIELRQAYFSQNQILFSFYYFFNYNSININTFTLYFDEYYKRIRQFLIKKLKNFYFENVYCFMQVSLDTMFCNILPHKNILLLKPVTIFLCILHFLSKTYFEYQIHASRV